MKKLVTGIVMLAFVLNAADQVHDLHYRYDRLKKYNRWFVHDLYNVIKPSLKEAHAKLQDVSSGIVHSIVGSHSYQQQEAQVRFTLQDDLCQAEQLYLKQRERNTYKGLQEFLGYDLEGKKEPRIAMCFSGGGFRAMILTLGFLIAAKEKGLLDATTYISGLSGSTWLMAPWIATKKPLEKIRDSLHEKIGSGLHHLTRHAERKQVIRQLMTKLFYKQSASAMDIYGPLLANTLLSDLGDRKLNATISDTHEHVLQGRYPLPIYTTIATNHEPYEWFEVTPFEIGSSALNAYIPVWSYGRKFKNGISVNYAPEQPMGYFMGIFGSAFEVDVEDIVRISAGALKEYKDDLPTAMHGAFDIFIDKLVNSPLDDVRLAPSMLRNFVYGAKDSPFNDQKTLSLVDAGIDFNLPFAPLLRAARNVDIIVVYDSSAGEVGSDLKKAASYAQRKGIKFPPVPDDVGQKLCSVLKDPTDSSCPIIIYMPRLKNPGYGDFDPAPCTEESYCNTFNFVYSKENIAELSGLSEYTGKQFMYIIKKVIAEVAARS